MLRFYTQVKVTLVTSYHEIIIAFMARLLFQAINLEMLCNLCTEKCENNAFENADTFDGWLCDFLFEGCVKMPPARVISDNSLYKTYIASVQ